MLAVGALGCLSSTDDEQLGGSHGTLDLTESEETALLAFVNDAATDLVMLDDEVGLNSRAAKNIITQRNGLDGVYPSADDHPYDTLAELDAVPYVGPAALTLLHEYVNGNQAPADITVEGVDFTQEQADAVVWGVNQATVAELDDEVGLDSRAAKNLVAAAPFASVAEMGPIGYVGVTALKKLRSHASTWQSEMDANKLGGTFDGVTFDEASAAVALEIANVASAEQLADGGITTSPRNKIIAGRPWANLASLSATSGIGPATMKALAGMVADWKGATVPAAVVTVQTLADEVANNGEQSQYFDKLVTTSRAIITTKPKTYSNGAMSFFIADPAAGNVEQLKVYVAAGAGLNLAFASLFDDVNITGKLTIYNGTWEILVDATDSHALGLNKSGVAYTDYATLLDAWSSTAANPEGAVLLKSAFGYMYKVPLPLFKDHPMYDNLPDPSDPSAVYGGNDHPGQLWCGDQQSVLDDWLAAQ